MLENKAIFEKFSLSILLLFENPIINGILIIKIIVDKVNNENNPDDDIVSCILELIYLSQ